jgi:hypothetical protein
MLLFEKIVTRQRPLRRRLPHEHVLQFACFHLSRSHSFSYCSQMCMHTNIVSMCAGTTRGCIMMLFVLCWIMVFQCRWSAGPSVTDSLLSIYQRGTRCAVTLTMTTLAHEVCRPTTAWYTAVHALKKCATSRSVASDQDDVDAHASFPLAMLRAPSTLYPESVQYDPVPAAFVLCSDTFAITHGVAVSVADDGGSCITNTNGSSVAGCDAVDGGEQQWRRWWWWWRRWCFVVY